MKQSPTYILLSYRSEDHFLISVCCLKKEGNNLGLVDLENPENRLHRLHPPILVVLSDPEDPEYPEVPVAMK